MKIIYTVLFACTFFSWGISQEKGGKYAEMNFENKKVSLADLEKQYTYGDTIQYKFEFSNDGELPLIISEVKSSCSCSVASYSNGKIEAGQKGFIELSTTYDQLELFRSVYITLITNSFRKYYKLTMKFD